METTTHERVQVSARIENLHDVFKAMDGRIKPEEIRSLDVHDALVDTGMMCLAMPLSMIEKLGLMHFSTRKARTSAGPMTVEMYSMARLFVDGRDSHVEVAEVPEDCPVLIGRIPLESLDFVVDPVGQRLVGNPFHGGEHMFDMF